MARAKTNKLYRTFVKGLITEAGYLTYPEDSSTAELNTVLSRKGNRTRRLGIDYEDAALLNDVAYDHSEKQIIKEFVWSNANDNPSDNFLVVQAGLRLHFFRLNSGTVSTQKAPFIINLAEYRTPGTPISTLYTTGADFASGSGYLFVVHPYCEPLNIEYDPDADNLIVISMIIQIRDLDGVDDGLPNDKEPNDLTYLHHYNLLNQGWGPPGTGGGGGYYYDPNTGNTGGTGGTGTVSPDSPGGTGPYDATGPNASYL